MIKFRLYFDKDKEEAFLNKMVSKGYAMRRGLLGIYCFDKCDIGEYTYRIELMKFKKSEQEKDYKEMIIETGVEPVQSNKPWIYFRKKGEFQLYTDNESKIEHYSRIKKNFINLTICITVLNLPQLMLFLSNRRNIHIPAVLINGITLSVFFIQVYKCNKKIETLRSENL